ncbi:MAG: hypothetical protein GC168_02615 [Candidatus Hydrogenedens sp.]|nr:hypothetical protein [Candidatus Hydrogenedens sp.]
MRWAIFLGAMALLGTAWAEDPWADAVVDFDDTGCNTGFCDPARTLGEPSGTGLSTPNLSDVHSVGTAGSYITLRFDTPVTDDAANPFGMDFIVFGNAFWVGGNPQRRWAEPGLVEIMQDTNNNGLPDDTWYILPGSRAITQAQAAAGIANPSPELVNAVGVENPNNLDANLSNDGDEYDWGYADTSPVDIPNRDNYLRPDDPFTVGLSPGSGGGDAFDIAWAVDGGGSPAGITSFSFIRIWTLVQGNAVGPITTELDAVADVAPDVDTDGDGVLDEYETRVANTDPARKGSSVLPLEVSGGSSAGTLLGTVESDEGHSLRLYSSGTRSGVRAFNTSIDIAPVPDPGGSVPGKLKSAAVAQFESDLTDFAAAQVQSAAIVFAYAPADFAGITESSLRPWRWTGAAWTQDGISGVTLDLTGNTITFRSQYPGTFVLAGNAVGGPVDGEPMPLTAWPAGLAMTAAGAAALRRRHRR